MNLGIIIPLGLVIVAILDATLGRWLAGKIASTFEATPFEGETPKSNKLLVYLPGILFDGVLSVAEITDALLKHFAGGLFISYGHWRFMPRHVILRTAQSIGRSDEPVQRYSSVVLMGASFGGRLAADVRFLLITEYGWEPDAVKLVMVDTPMEVRSFRDTPRKTAYILRLIPVGPLLSWIFAFVLFVSHYRLYVAPMDHNIEPGLDFDDVKRTALRRMAAFMLSCVADQQRYLANNSAEWLAGTRKAHVVYMSCERDNVTIIQPLTWHMVERDLNSGYAASFSVRVVDSTHCGFLERQATWRREFDDLFSKM